MSRWAAVLCVVVWSYPLGTFEAMRSAETIVEIRVCEPRETGQRFVEVWKVSRFVDGGFIKEQMEVRLPWGTEGLPKAP